MRAVPSVGLAAVAVAVSATAGQARPALQTVTAKETNFKIALSARPRVGTVVFVARNASSIVHDLWVRGGAKPSARLRTTLKKGVRYRIWCAVDAHAKLGMNRFLVAR